jgi:hypothetical protein
MVMTRTVGLAVVSSFSAAKWTCRHEQGMVKVSFSQLK